MKWKNWLEKWEMTSLRINLPYLEMEWNPSDPDRAAAWDLYVELLTRITTQALSPSTGDEKTALDSVYSIFPTTRSVLRHHGRGCTEFTKIAVVILNQKIRPFTAKWHRVSLQKDLLDPEIALGFRKELDALQVVLRQYTGMLAEMAGLEDNLLDLEAPET